MFWFLVVFHFHVMFHYRGHFLLVTSSTKKKIMKTFFCSLYFFGHLPPTFALFHFWVIFHQLCHHPSDMSSSISQVILQYHPESRFSHVHSRAWIYLTAIQTQSRTSSLNQLLLCFLRSCSQVVDNLKYIIVMNIICKKK